MSNERRRKRGNWYWWLDDGNEARVYLRGPGFFAFRGLAVPVPDQHKGHVFKAPKGTWWVWQGAMGRHGVKGSAPTLREAMRALAAMQRMHYEQQKSNIR